MEQKTNINISTTSKDLDKLIASVQNDIAKLRAMTKDKNLLLERLHALRDEVNKDKGAE